MSDIEDSKASNDDLGDLRGLWREDKAPPVKEAEAKIEKARKRTNFAVALEALVMLISGGFALYMCFNDKLAVGLPLLIYVAFAGVVSAVQRRHSWQVFIAPLTDTIEALDSLERGRIYEAYACLLIGFGMVLLFWYLHATYKPMDAIGVSIAVLFLGGSWLWAFRQIRSAKKRRDNLAKMRGAVRSIPS